MDRAVVDSAGGEVSADDDDVEGGAGTIGLY